jgi:hypothetical protein
VLLLLYEGEHPRRLDRGLRDELELDRSVARVDARDAERLAEDAQAVAFDQRSGGVWRRPEAVDQFLAE